MPLRYLAVDFGAARTGLALSDIVGVTCRPLAVIEQRDETTLVAAILAIVESEAVGAIVVGLPRPLSGGTNRQLEKTQDFAARLAGEAPVPVVCWDERFTTKLAERGRKTPGAADSVAACHLLQNYLDFLCLRSDSRVDDLT